MVTLLKFIDSLNNVHPNIKFTHSYSRDTATFLDVNIGRTGDGNFDFSVHEKPTNTHQYIEFSSCHPLSCKKGIPYSQAKRYRRLTSNDDLFTNELEKLRTYFQNRNYPSHILDDALAKASALSTEEAMTNHRQNTDDIIPFVCIYNPSLPNIGQILNKYWGLFELSEKSSVRILVKCKPIIAYKRPTNLSDILVHSSLMSSDVNGGVLKCNRTRCSHCANITESVQFTSSQTLKTYDVKENLNCMSENVIYLITCKKCKLQYVGQTHQKCSQRMNSHKFDIRHFPDTPTNVSEHFNSENHSVSDFSFMPIDLVKNDWFRLLKETRWIHTLNTAWPHGMNAKILF
ncbi:uncharacterized protein LOC123529459 [Mercenaria mercenaria]|uniref:uncharacterized protein LOC123529459 n=1 Tax=Mercenaria mercenaria TaxID=6596 RepID=UPI00234F4FBF|nr:uncharacterized protein LOC123529459 [Mercenaria mercenaria]